MKNKIILTIIIFVLCIFHTSTVFAKRSGKSSALFLSLAASARSAAMGGAYSALADDINSVFYNPAGLGFVKFKEFTFMNNSYIEDLKHNYAAYCQYFPQLKGTFGVSYNSFDAGKFERFYIDGSLTPTAGGSFSANDHAVSLSYGQRIYKNYYAGLTIKHIYSKIDNTVADASAIDFGALAVFEPDFIDAPARISVTAHNLGQKMKYDKKKESLPENVKCGLGVKYDLTNIISAEYTIEAIYTNDRDIFCCLGGEVGLSNTIFFRAGFNNFNEAGNGLSLGIGIKYYKTSIDYSFESYNSLDDAHRISLTSRF